MPFEVMEDAQILIVARQYVLGMLFACAQPDRSFTEGLVRRKLQETRRGLKTLIEGQSEALE